MSDYTAARDSIDRLESVLTGYGDIAIAVSGGIDSMILCYVAHRHIYNAFAFHAKSPAVPGSATDRAITLASAEGWNFKIIDAKELEDKNYTSNPVNRCYYCKSNLYSTIRMHTELPIASGANLDDLSDYRPGLQAAAEHKVKHPYIEANIGKQEIRQIASFYGLPDLAELPSSPCLSSRLETGISVNANSLSAIDDIEIAVRYVTGASIIRCRIRSNGVYIELDDKSFSRLREEDKKEIASAVVKFFPEVGQQGNLYFQLYKKGGAFLRA